MTFFGLSFYRFFCFFFLSNRLSRKRSGRVHFPPFARGRRLCLVKAFFTFLIPEKLPLVPLEDLESGPPSAPRSKEYDQTFVSFSPSPITKVAFPERGVLSSRSARRVTRAFPLGRECNVSSVFSVHFNAANDQQLTLLQELA